MRIGSDILNNGIGEKGRYNRAPRKVIFWVIPSASQSANQAGVQFACPKLTK